MASLGDCHIAVCVELKCNHNIINCVCYMTLWAQYSIDAELFEEPKGFWEQSLSYRANWQRNEHVRLHQLRSSQQLLPALIGACRASLPGYLLCSSFPFRLDSHLRLSLACALSTDTRLIFWSPSGSHVSNGNANKY